MAIILFITGVIGFLASFLLLHLGLAQMIFRYPLAVLFAYGVFLFLVWLWIGRRSRHKSYRDLDPGLLDFDFPSSGSARPELSGGGHFGGGGAGRSWEFFSEPTPHLSDSPMEYSGSSGSFFEHWHVDFGIDLDEGVLLLIPILLALTVALAALYVIYLAPAFVFELLIDTTLAGTLYTRFRKGEPRDWLGSAVRWTWIPAILTALVFAVGGYAIQHFAPHAVSIGQVWAAGR